MVRTWGHERSSLCKVTLYLLAAMEGELCLEFLDTYFGFREIKTTVPWAVTDESRFSAVEFVKEEYVQMLLNKEYYHELIEMRKKGRNIRRHVL
jgi:hypothetical protein